MIDGASVWILAQKELRNALRNRWFVLYTIAFTALALAFSYLSLAGAGIVGFAGFGRTAASLINLVMLIVPLMALTAGAQSLAGERENATLAYLLAQPVSRADVFLGKFLGLTLSLIASLTLGFGLSGLLLAANGAGAEDPAVYVRLVLMALLVGMAMLGIGILVSSFARRADVAVGIALFLWLGFVFFGDLGMMGTAIVLRVPVDGLFAVALANPLQVFKMAAILNLNAGLDILGPAGLFAMQQYGATLLTFFVAMLVLWIVVPTAIAFVRFSKSGDL